MSKNKKRKKVKTPRKINQNRRVSKTSKFYIPELCVRCKFKCNLRVLKGGELLECPRYGKIGKTTEVIIVS